MKLRIKLRRQLRLENVFFFVAALCVFSFALLEHTSITITAFSAAKFPILYVGGICIVTQVQLLLNNFRKRRYFYVEMVLLLICVCLLVTAVVKRPLNIGDSPMRHTLRLILYLLELFLLMIWAAETGKVRYLLNFLFWYLLVLTIITDVFLFSGVIKFYSGRHELFLVGTKFSVAYLHINLLALWFLRNDMRFFRGNRSKFFVVIGVALILGVSIRVDCMTGVLGCVVLFILLLLLNTSFQRKFLRLRSPWLLGLALCASVVFPFLAERIVSIPVVEYFLEEIFGRDTTLTGRMIAFTTFERKMAGNWLWGYGYGNGNAASEALFGIANAQNALLHWILEAGVIVTLLLTVMMVVIFRQIVRSDRQRMVMPLVVLIYVYIVLGTVETTFNMSFLLWFALIFAQLNEKEQRIT